MPKYTESDAAKDTGATGREVSQAWHDARDDAAKEGGHSVPADRHGEGGGLVGSILSGIGNILKGGKKED